MRPIHNAELESCSGLACSYACDPYQDCDIVQQHHRLPCGPGLAAAALCMSGVLRSWPGSRCALHERLPVRGTVHNSCYELGHEHDPASQQKYPKS